MFFDTFKQLCEQKGLSPNAVGKVLGVSSASITKWKKGAIPKFETRLRISSYFGIPVECLLSESEIQEREGLRDHAKRIESAAKSLLSDSDFQVNMLNKRPPNIKNKPAVPKDDELNSDLAKLESLLSKMTDEDIDDIIKFAEFLTEKHNKK